MTTLQVLKKARALLVEGWCRYAFSIREGNKVKYCAVGAIGHVMKDPDDDGWFYEEPVSAIADAAGVDFYSVADWNNRQRDKRAVLRVFDRAIRTLEAKR